jgi:hypothetical protein
MNTTSNPKKGKRMSKPRNTLTSLLSRLGVAGPARLRVSPGSGAPKIASGTGASKITPGGRALIPVLVLAMTLAALAFAATPALAFETHVVAKSIGEGVKGSSAGQLESANSVAVNDTTGDVYVADTGNDRIDEFEGDGAFVRAWGWGVADGLPMFETCGPDAFPPTATCRAGISGSGAGQFTTPAFIAVDNSAGLSKGDVYIGDTGDNLVTKFSAEGVLESAWGDTASTPNGQLAGNKSTSGSLSRIAGVAVDLSGDLDVLSEGSEFFKFTQAGAFSEEFAVARGTAQVGLAVDSEGNIFKLNGSPSVEEITGSDSDVGQVTSESVSPVGFAADGVTRDLYVDTGGQLEQYDFSAPGIVSESGGTTCTVEPDVGCPATISFGSGDIAGGAGVAVDSSTHTVYVADASADRIDVFTGPVILPDVTTTAPTAVKGHSATLAGSVDPDKEGAAKCQFEWGTTKEFGNTAPCEPVEVPEGNSPVTVGAKLTGLQPDTTYYYRLQATNKNGLNAGEASQDLEFTTAGPGMHGESVSNVAATSVTLDASIDPNNGSLSAVPNVATSYYFQYSTASTAGCEASPASCTSVPVAPGEAIGPGESDLAVSRHVQGLAAGTVYHYRVVALSESAGELITVAGPDQTFTTQLAGGGFMLPDGRQWELVSPPDKHGALVDPHSTESQLEQASVDGDAMTFLASTPTESESQGFAEKEQVFSARGPDGWVSRDITPPHEHAAGIAFGYGEEYVDFSEDLSLAVVQPHGPFEQSLSPEASELTAYLRTIFLNGNVNDPCVESCYRPLVTAKPGYANVPPGTVFGEGCEPGNNRLNLCGPLFTGATPDLSHIALRSEEPLLPGSSRYEEYEWVDGRLSPGSHLPGLRVLTSEDGSWSYSVSGTSLYVSHGGLTKLIAVLSGADHPDWEGPYNGTSRVSPDGRWLAFMSDEELTGYDNHDAVSGQPDEEVYLYHAPEDLASEVGTLVCASCNPTGARPVGVEYDKLHSEEGDLAIGSIAWLGEDPWIAANVPGWEKYAPSETLHQPRYLSDSGRLFFDSSDALVPQDVNGTEDVYEYEPPGVSTPGVSSCTTASAQFSAHSSGCVDLISSGQDARESAFLDASESGGDVFFVTAARLVPQDYDSALDVYDAHECTNAAPCSPAPELAPPPCDTGDSCKPAPTPQPTIFGSAPSATFSGPGNITPEVAPPLKKIMKKTVRCRKGFVKNKQGKCVKKPKKKKTKAIKSAHINRTTSR